MTRKQKKVLIRIIISFVILAAEMIFFAVTKADLGKAAFVPYLIPYLIIGYDILRKAFLGLIHLNVFDENFLMTIATIGAFATGEYAEGTAVMLFYQTGELFQSCAVDKSRKSISELMDIRPDYACIENENGELIEVSPEEVAVGTVFTVKPGERIPLDGVIVSGTTVIDTTALTGESVPREAYEGSKVISGCINLSGAIKVRAEKEYGESTVSKILEMVENAQEKKSKSENFISAFAKIYTPVVVAAAALLAIIPPIVTHGSFADWIHRSMTFLVISCPCALVISVPLSYFCGIGGASKKGILIKGSTFIDAVSKASEAVFDKTGTLTHGSFEVTELHPVKGDDELLLKTAAAAEIYSVHPAAVSLKNAWGNKGELPKIKDVHEKAGHGVSAYFTDGHHALIGNMKLMQSEKITGISLWEPINVTEPHINNSLNSTNEEAVGTPLHTSRCEPNNSTEPHINNSLKFINEEAVGTPHGTVIHAALDGEYLGYIIISDRIKESSAEAIAELKKSGVEKTVMLTGDDEYAAKDCAQKLGIDEYHSRLLPDDKVRLVEKLMDEKPENTTLIFTGDGINDAPVLTRADVGIAMGAIGSDAAIEAADIVIMDDDPRKIAEAVRISRKTVSIVKMNIVFALAVKFAVLILGALNLAGMWAAVFADVGVSVIAILNAMRCSSGGHRN